MADQEKDSQERPAIEIDRRSIGALVVVQLIAATCLFLALNYLSGSNHKTWDLSQNSDFSLSSQTKNLLRSKLLQGREQPVHLIAVVRKESTHYARLHAVLEDYERFADGKITLEFVDPQRDTDLALEKEDHYNINFVEDIVLIDAVPTLPPAPENGEDAEAHAKNIAALRRSHIRYVAVEDMLVFAGDSGQQRRLIGYQDEDQLTAGIRRSIEGTARQFYFLADKSQVPGAQVDAPWDFLSRTFDNLNIKLTPIQISGLARIPDEAAGVALVAPRFDLNARELEVFKEYWNRPRSAVLVLIDPTLKEQPKNLRAFLRDHGVTPRETRLSTTHGNTQAYDVAATFSNAAALGDLANASTIFEGASSTLEVREGDPKLGLEQIVPLPLITALPRYQAHPLDGSDPLRGPHYLGASISRGNETNDATAADTSRMIVVSNSDFLQPAKRHSEHIDFLRNTTNWLVGREELMGIGPKPVKYYKLLLPAKKVSFANKLNLFFIPGAFCLVAVFVWNARRA